MTGLTEYAPAKVNLSLHVGPVKANGRHNLNSLVTFADDTASDILMAEPATSFSLAVEGPFAEQAGPAKNNLVLQAARVLNDALDGNAPPLAFRLNKRLPCAAGIGGGSADAAAALRLMIRAHGGDRVVELAKDVAPGLGGDVLACLIGIPGMMSGEGEDYEPMLAIPPLPALLVNPGASCPTGLVFNCYDEIGVDRTDHPLPKAGRARDGNFRTYLAKQTTNSLETAAQALVPEIQTTLEALRGLSGARLVRMSGSGATCFALFDTIKKAESAAAKISQAHPTWWAKTTMLGTRS